MNKPLLDQNNFKSIFSNLKNKRIGYIVMFGNVGDKLIEGATIQLFHKFKINYKYANCKKNPGLIDEKVCNSVDEFLVSGGGNMGNLYKINKKIRKELFKYKKPIIILPQSFTSKENLPYSKIWVRERDSLKFRPDARVGPDLALAYHYKKKIPKPKYDLGIWTRSDIEKKVFVPNSLGDPVKKSNSPEEYILLAAKYRRIITDRLHFAIAGLIAGREVTLLPNSYFKNEAIWESSLKKLGCKFDKSYEIINYNKRKSKLEYFLEKAKIKLSKISSLLK